MSENIKYPTLHVKNFAKIKEAKIELSPFTLFIGDNNSGKSYLMTLIYGLIGYTGKILDIILNKYKEDIEKLDEYKKAQSIIESYINNLDFNKEVELSSEEVEIFIELFNLLLNKYSNEVINYIFNSNNEIELENIKLEFYSNQITFVFEKENRINVYSNNEEINLFYIKNIRSGDTISSIKTSFNNDYIHYNNIITTIISFIISNYFDASFLSLYSNREIFLPVSRTGFLLSRNDIASSARASKYDRYAEKNNEYLSRPIMDFLDNFDELSKQKNDIADIAKTLIDFIEKNMLFGKIMINEETKNIYYKPDNTELEFQMYLSSAVVTELTPLYLFLKYGFIKRKLLMEEPEISLHPQLQQQLTRLFIKLVNTGTDITITTHSDTIIQHINNMIKLNNNKEDIKKELMKKYNYNEDDLISEDKVRMYQFDIKEDGFTEITEIKGSKYGFQAPTFHKYLMQSSEEFEAFIEDLDN